MLNEQDIENYINGQQRGKQANRLEREAQNDPFLADALEGFEQAGKHADTVKEMKRFIAPKNNRKMLYSRFIATAAVLLLCLTVGSIFLSTNKRAAIENSALAKNMESVEQDYATVLDYYPKDAILEKKAIEKEEISIAMVDEKPLFKDGGDDAFARWVGAKIPCSENAISGQAVVEFVVGPDGKTSDIKIVRGVDMQVDAEIVSLIANSPKWRPGLQDNQPVAVKCVLMVAVCI